MYSLVAIKSLTNIGSDFLRKISDLLEVTYILVSKHRDIIGKCIYDELARAGMPQDEGVPIASVKLNVIQSINLSHSKQEGGGYM